MVITKISILSKLLILVLVSLRVRVFVVINSSSWLLSVGLLSSWLDLLRFGLANAEIRMLMLARRLKL